MALVMVLMQLSYTKVTEEKKDAEVSGIPANLLDPQVQEAMTEVMKEAVTQRWDNRSFAVTSEEGAPGDNRALLTIYAQCDVTGRS